MKRYLFLVMAAGVALLSCNKTIKTICVSGPEGMRFRASASSTKSHFESDDASNTNLQLYWDEYDNLAVYSVDPSDPSGSAVSGTAYIQSGVGETVATFMSAIPEDEWYDNAAADGSKRFFAYYPALSPYEFDEVDEEPVLPVHLESSQYHKSNAFGAYHLMVSRGGTFSPGGQVEFNDFTPVTSLLKFRLKMDDGFDYAVKSIYVEPYIYGKYSEDDTSDGYHSSIVTGSTLDPSTGGSRSTYEYVERLVGTRYIKLSTLLSEDSLQLERYDMSYLYEDAQYLSDWYIYPYEQSTLWVYSADSDSQDAYSLNGDAGDVLYASVFPTINYPSRGALALAVYASYYVSIDMGNYGSGYNVTHIGYITIPEPGFEAGKRYDFVLTLTPDEMRVEFINAEVDFSYDVVNW